MDISDDSQIAYEVRHSFSKPNSEYISIGVCPADMLFSKYVKTLINRFPFLNRKCFHVYHSNLNVSTEVYAIISEKERIYMELAK